MHEQVDAIHSRHSKCKLISLWIIATDRERIGKATRCRVSVLVVAVYPVDGIAIILASVQGEFARSYANCTET